MLRRIEINDVPARSKTSLDAETLDVVQRIIEDVEQNREKAVRQYALRFEEISESQSIWLEEQDLLQAYNSLSKQEQELLQRTAKKIRSFAEAQRATCQDLSVTQSFGTMGHRWMPIDRAGCYAPGGRYPLPSSVLMTSIPALIAGVSDVVITSPRPAKVTLAAAHIAGVSRVLRIGGAHAIAAFAFGLEGMEPRDIVVGPGNRFVTAAKKLLFGTIGIDSLAGPSELLIIADDSARADWIAADLIAQAEHDDDAIPSLVTTSEALIAEVNQELTRQLSDLPTQTTARRALENGFALCVDSLEEAARISNSLAPEHLEVHTRKMPEGLRNYGALFIGEDSAEVFGDYGAGPNHTLPTGRAARFSSGLSVFHFLKAQTFIEIIGTASTELIDDTARFARLEGLEGHARAAEIRR